MTVLVDSFTREIKMKSEQIRVRVELPSVTDHHSKVQSDLVFVFNNDVNELLAECIQIATMFITDDPDRDEIFKMFEFNGGDYIYQSFDTMMDSMDMDDEMYANIDVHKCTDLMYDMTYDLLFCVVDSLYRHIDVVNYLIIIDLVHHQHLDRRSMIPPNAVLECTCHPIHCEGNDEKEYQRTSRQSRIARVAREERRPRVIRANNRGGVENVLNAMGIDP